MSDDGQNINLNYPAFRFFGEISLESCILRPPVKRERKATPYRDVCLMASRRRFKSLGEEGLLPLKWVIIDVHSGRQSQSGGSSFKYVSSIFSKFPKPSTIFNSSCWVIQLSLFETLQLRMHQLILALQMFQKLKLPSGDIERPLILVDFPTGFLSHPPPQFEGSHFESSFLPPIGSTAFVFGPFLR